MATKKSIGRFTSSLNKMAEMMPKNKMLLPSTMTEHLEMKQTIDKLDEPVYFAFCLAVMQVGIRATFGHPDAPFVGSFFMSGSLRTVNTRAEKSTENGRVTYVQAEVPEGLRDSFRVCFMDRYLSEVADEKGTHLGQWKALGDKALMAGRSDKNGDGDPVAQALAELVAVGLLQHPKKTYSFRSTWPKLANDKGTPVTAKRLIRRF
jgi:hypothetical protein